jgi:hypothetical protein
LKEYFIAKKLSIQASYTFAFFCLFLVFPHSLRLNFSLPPLFFFNNRMVYIYMYFSMMLFNLFYSIRLVPFLAMSLNLMHWLNHYNKGYNTHWYVDVQHLVLSYHLHNKRLNIKNFCNEVFTIYFEHVIFKNCLSLFFLHY